MIGYVLNGKYIKAKPPKSLQDNSQWKQWEHERQRQEHGYELIQPYANGQPNPEFIEHYPEESKNYGFIRSEDV